MSALRSGISVLKTFGESAPELGVTEIAALVGLHKSTVSRVLATLQELGLVERDTVTRRFRLGLGVIALAGPMLAELDVRRIAYPVLQELTQRTGETAALMVWDDTAAVCVEQVPSTHQVKHTTPLGTRYRTTSDSSVSVFLAEMQSAHVRELLSSGQVGGPQLDAASIDAYVERLGEAKRSGFTLNYGETSIEEVGISAPVYDHRGHVTAAVLASAPYFRVSRQQLEPLVQAVRDAAQEVTRRLGGHREVPAQP
ncbi:MAG: IclR family transcriptional regulator [Nocardioidaceae bacterium]